MVVTLIANYNYGKYLIDAIDSALNQTVENFIVFVDDFSVDNSVSLAANKLKTKFDKTITLKDMTFGLHRGENSMVIQLGKNCGPSRARNIGISASLKFADFYQILDADDIMYPNKIETLIKEMHDNIGVTYGDYDIINEDHIITREYKQPFSMQSLMKECIVHSGSLIRANTLKQVVNQYGFYNETMRVAEDYDLWLRIAKHGWSIRHIAEPLTLVRTHSENSTNSVPKHIWEDCWHKICQNNS